jgi:hypothetical protein
MNNLAHIGPPPPHDHDNFPEVVASTTVGDDNFRGVVVIMISGKGQPLRSGQNPANSGPAPSKLKVSSD